MKVVWSRGTRATVCCASLTLRQLSLGWARNRLPLWLHGWQDSSSDRSKEGGVLTAVVATEVQGESTPREVQQVDVREPERVADGQFRYLPTDS